MCSRLDSVASRMSRTLLVTFPASVRRPAASVFVAGVLLGIFLVLSGCGAGGSNGTDERPDDTTPPNAPTGLSGTSGDTEIVLRWDTVPASDLKEYKVYRATSTSIEDISSRNPVSSLSDTSFTDTGLTNGTEYSYVVTAVDDSGNESGPSTLLEKTPFPDPPARP
jgi:fibronectin type 3 domain-containing protein